MRRGAASSRAMSLFSLLATMSLISLVNSTPMMYAAEQRAKIPVDQDNLLLIFLLNRRDFGAKGHPIDDIGSPYTIDTNDQEDLVSQQQASNRDKRIGSLSVVNSVDVLRERVLLELARRKAMEDQGLFGKNRDLVSSIGKRSGMSSYKDHRGASRKKEARYVVDAGRNIDRFIGH